MECRKSARRIVLAAALVGLASPAAAAAAGPPGLGSSVTGLHRFERGFVVLSGERVRIRSNVLNAPAGSALVVSVTWRRHRVLARRRAVTGNAIARYSLIAPGPGPLTVRIRLDGPNARTLRNRPALGIGVIQPGAGAGARGLRVRFLQRGLARMRYAIAITGSYDDSTRRAVIAFRKVNRMPRVGSASRAVFVRVASGRGAFRPRHRGAAHVEGDLSRQVLALVNSGGRVFKVYVTSSGRPSLSTPAGVRTIYRKQAGWNAEGQLDSAYFTTLGNPRPFACAIHGYPDVPTWNASHCCLRVPIPDARKIFNWVRIGERIYVYY